MSTSPLSRFNGLEWQALDSLIDGFGEAHPIRLKWTITDEEGSPWLLVTAEGAEPYDIRMTLPRDFAIWRSTGAIHQVLHQEVLDPPLVEGEFRQSQPGGSEG